MGNKKEYYPKLKEYIKEFGEWNLTYLTLSKKWGISTTTLYRWRDKIVQELGPIDLKKVDGRIQKQMISNFDYLQRLSRTAKTEGLRISAIKTFNDIVKGFTDFLESYGYKKKIADKLEVTQKEKTIEERFKEFLKINK